MHYLAVRKIPWARGARAARAGCRIRAGGGRARAGGRRRKPQVSMRAPRVRPGSHPRLVRISRRENRDDPQSTSGPPAEQLAGVDDDDVGRAPPFFFWPFLRAFARAEVKGNAKAPPIILLEMFFFIYQSCVGWAWGRRLRRRRAGRPPWRGASRARASCAGSCYP